MQRYRFERKNNHKPYPVITARKGMIDSGERAESRKNSSRGQEREGSNIPDNAHSLFEKLPSPRLKLRRGYLVDRTRRETTKKLGSFQAKSALVPALFNSE